MSSSRSDPTALAHRLAPPRSRPAASPRDQSCQEFDIRIARDGTWFYHGSPITRKPLVRLFASVLRRDEAGGYWLQTPAEKGRIEVEDAPFVAVEVRAAGEGCAQELTFRTNLDEQVTAGPEHHIRVMTEADRQTPRPYLHVRDRLEALIARPVFYELVDLGVDDGGRFGVWSGGCFFSLGPAT